MEASKDNVPDEKEPKGASEKDDKDLVQKCVRYLLSPQDPSNLAILRIMFGILMLIDFTQERGLPDLHEKWGDPDSCFFPLFDWLRPLPIDWMYVVYMVMFLGEVGIVLGLFYRLSCLAFVVCYWYIFFLDKGVWNNHSYLYGLTGFMLLITDTNRYWSLDGLISPRKKNAHIPMWNYVLFRFQIFLVYFYAGLKKLDLDWVFGYSMSGLSRAWVFDPFKLFLTHDAIDHFMVHICGLIFDLTEGFMLVWDKTRPLGIFLGSTFHLMNSQMFHIGMFPWTMLATMPLFCNIMWPKKVLAYLPTFMKYVMPTTDSAQTSKSCVYAEAGKGTDDKAPKSMQKKHAVMLSILAFYVGTQLFLPYSHFITKGYNSWTQGLYGYSWDMMVHSWQTQHIRIKVVDQKTNEVTFIKPGAFIGGGSRRHSRWSSHPDMIMQYVRCLERQLKNYPSVNITEPAIYLDIWRSMNSRFQQRLVDPRVDFVKAKWSPFKDTTWLQPLLIELSPWRAKFGEIQEKTRGESEFTDFVFVADFPGLFLENFIQEGLDTSVSVLSGKIKVEIQGRNITLGVGEETPVPSNETHFVHTISEGPSCYMYVYVNSTLASMNETEREELDQILESSPESQDRRRRKEEWRNKSTIAKFSAFLNHKFMISYIGFYDAYHSIKHLALGTPYPWGVEEEVGMGEEQQRESGSDTPIPDEKLTDTATTKSHEQQTTEHKEAVTTDQEAQDSVDQGKTEL